MTQLRTHCVIAALGDLNLDDEALKRLEIQNVNGVSLRGNPITDKSLEHLASLQYIDLSGTECLGAELELLTKVRTVILDGTPVDDAAIAQLVASNPVLSRLSLRKTQVTEETLKTLAVYRTLMELELGDGEITADGLATTAFAPADRLTLNSMKFTGNVFACGSPRAKTANSVEI